MKLRQPRGGALTSCVERDPDPAQIGSVSKGAIGDGGDPSSARQACHEHQTARAGARVSAAVDDESLAGLDALDGVPLQIARQPDRLEGVEILAGRDVPHRECGGRETDRRRHGPDVDEHLVAEPVLEELGRDRGRRRPSKPLEDQRQFSGLLVIHALGLLMQ